jgi:hypothetical protein
MAKQAAVAQAIEALRKAIQLADIASDWNLDRWRLMARWSVSTT